MQRKEFIEFLVEECYSNFPELVEKFSKKGMYKVLNYNIKFIKKAGTNDLWDGSYNSGTRMIQFYNLDDLNMDVLKSNVKLKNVASHEGIHALFRKNFYDTGCHRFDTIPNIKKFARITKMNFKSSITILEKIRALANIRKNYATAFEQGRGLNEGFTEWVNSKCTYERTYFHEVNIIKQLETFRKKEDILKIGDGNMPQLADLFNMDYKEFNVFMNQIDEMHYDEGKIDENIEVKILKEWQDSGRKAKLERFSEKSIKKLTTYGVIKNGEIISEKLDEVYEKKIKTFEDSHTIVATEIQKKLLQKVILPELEQSMDGDDEGFKKCYRAKGLMEIFMYDCKIEEKDIPELNEFYLYDQKLKQWLQKNEQEYIEKIKKMKNESEKVNLNELDEAIKNSPKYFPSGFHIVPISLQVALGRTIKEEEFPEIYEEFHDLVHYGREEQKQYKFWGSDKFEVSPANEKIKQEDFDTQEIANNQSQIAYNQVKNESFFKRLVKKIIKKSKITVEEIDNCELTNENELENKKGEENIEK